MPKEFKILLTKKTGTNIYPHAKELPHTSHFINKLTQNASQT